MKTAVQRSLKYRAIATVLFTHYWLAESITPDKKYCHEYYKKQACQHL